MSKFMDNKQEMLLAIENYDCYTLVQRKILQCLVEVAINETVVITPDKLAKMVGTTRSTIYPALKLFREDNFIIPDHKRKERSKKLLLNKEKLKEVIEIFQKQRNFIQK